jgi:putative endonuclease
MVYLLICSDQTLYCGITNDLERRIKEHNGSKRGAKYTRTRRPVKLYRQFPVDNLSEALKLEAKIKKLSRKEKLIYECAFIKSI